MKPRYFLLPFAAFAVAALVACGGDKKSAASASSGGSGSTTELNLSKSADKIAELKSFRYDVTLKLDASAPPSGGANSQDAMLAGAFLGALSDIKAEGSYASPDKTQMKIKVLGQEVEMISIGSKSYVKFGGAWQMEDASSSGTSLPSSPADLISGVVPGDVIKGAKTSSETVNGVKATKYSFDKAALEKAAKDSGEDTSEFKNFDKAEVNVWLNGDNVPVKMSMLMNGKDENGQKVAIDMQMNIKDINAGIDIKAPI